MGYTAYNVCSFFLRGAVYCIEEGIISRHTAVDVVGSTARGPALTRDSLDLIVLLPSGLSHRSLWSSAVVSGCCSVYAVYILIGTRCTGVVVVASFTGRYVYSKHLHKSSPQ